jgi:hypothetical protein
MNRKRLVRQTHGTGGPRFGAGPLVLSLLALGDAK